MWLSPPPCPALGSHCDLFLCPFSLVLPFLKSRLNGLVQHVTFPIGFFHLAQCTQCPRLKFTHCCSSELLVLLFYCIALFTHSEGNPLSQFPWAGVVFLGHGTPETKTRVICCLTGSLVEGHSHCFQVLCVCVVLNTRSVWSVTESGLLVTAGVGLLGQIPRHGACPAV